MHKVKPTFVRITECCLVVWTVFLYSSGFSTDYISRSDVRAVSHTLGLFENPQNELMIDGYDKAAIVRL